MDFVTEGGIWLILTLDFVNFGGFRGFREFRFLDPPWTDVCSDRANVKSTFFNFWRSSNLVRSSTKVCVWIFSTAVSRGTEDVWSGRREVKLWTTDDVKWVQWSRRKEVRKSPCRAAKWLSRPGHADPRARERRTVFCGILSVYFLCKRLWNYIWFSAHL